MVSQGNRDSYRRTFGFFLCHLQVGPLPAISGVTTPIKALQMHKWDFNPTKIQGLYSHLQLLGAHHVKKKHAIYLEHSRCYVHFTLNLKPLKTNSHSCPRKIGTSYVVFPGSISTQKATPENGGKNSRFQSFGVKFLRKETRQPPPTKHHRPWVPRTALGTAVDTVVPPATFVVA